MHKVPAFFEAVFAWSSELDSHWQDRSTEEFYIFTSLFGTLHLRKRSSYPSTYARTEGSKLYFGYGSEAHGKNITYGDLELMGDTVFSEKEFLYAEADLKGQILTLQRDSFSTLPVFCATQEATLALSNHSELLYDILKKDKLNISVSSIVDYLVYGDLHYHPISEINALYDRVRLTWNNRGPTIHYPADSVIASAYELGDGDPKRFKEVLEFILDKYWDRYDNIGFQLSGGLDSATAPGYYATRGHDVTTAALGLPGTTGRHQQEKLDNMTQRFGINNHIIMLNPETHFPLVDIIVENTAIPCLYSDLHLSPTRQLAEYYVQKGIDTVFTGVGGDELCQNLPMEDIFLRSNSIREIQLQKDIPGFFTPSFHQLHNELQSDAPSDFHRPVPMIAGSVHQTHLGFNNTFIDRNVWPVAPLSDPSLFIYAQSVPSWYRHNKGLLRMYQYARNFPSSIVQPSTLEDFGEFMHYCKPKLKPLFDTFFASSVMAEKELLDKGELSAYIDETLAVPYDNSDIRILKLIRLLSLEITLQRLSRSSLSLL